MGVAFEQEAAETLWLRLCSAFSLASIALGREYFLKENK